MFVTGLDGVVAQAPDGRFWSRTEQDGNAQLPVGDDDGFGPIDKARIGNPKFCHKSTDMTWDPERAGRTNPEHDALSKCTLVWVRVRTIYELLEDR
jgi:hypothetical protein